MNWRKLLLPLSGLFWIGVSLRNLAYSTGLLRSVKFKNPVVCVGNLSVGGTGKSPHVIMVADILKHEFQTAMLSRGYGRKTSGLVIANYSSKVYDIGDEPLQFFNRFRNRIVVAVSENRVIGIRHLIKFYKSEVILMDDGFQHRQVRPGYSILLTDFNDPYTSDYLLPAGNLREPRSGARRADVIVVTKCPDAFTIKQRDAILAKINPRPHQKVYFSKVVYSNSAIGYRFSLSSDEWRDYEVVLVTGIAKAKPFVDYVKSRFKTVHHMEFSDHYNFSVADIQRIDDGFDRIQALHKIILTTEKDYMRLKDESALIENLFYLPIEVELNDWEDFRENLLNYVRKN
ncbi:MAG: tetraacyldisaccharide 4'-kinase [Flavobacteriaceae bacterium]|jgi:tetraacyldisaccharide 4'-kinase|nr:tetraacyldisaccharide 4'-kinase [Flavobacteriaceae bacterium]